MSERELVCIGCGKPDTVSEECSVPGWRSVDPTLNEDGTISVSVGFDTDVDWANAEVWNYSCSECGKTAGSIENLVKPSDAVVEPQPGEIVWDPMGCRAVVERVDGDDVYVVGFPVPYPRAALTQPKPPLPSRLTDVAA